MHCPRTITINLEGSLTEFADRVEYAYYGEFRLSDAVALIDINHPGFVDHIRERELEGSEYYVIEDGRSLTATELAYPLGAEITLGELPSGADGKALNLLGSAIVVGLGIVTGNPALIVGGALSLAKGVLSRPISVNKEDEKDKRKSSYFSTASGNAADLPVVPRWYGASVDINNVLIGSYHPAYAVSMLIENKQIDPDDD